jgi:hypothetical protein
MARSRNRRSFNTPENLALPGVVKNRGFLHERTQSPHGDLEKAFADSWEQKAEYLMPLLFRDGGHQALTVSLRDRFVAATVIQWLGTNIGFHFTCSALKQCGYEVIEKKHLDELYKQAASPIFMRIGGRSL